MRILISFFLVFTAIGYFSLDSHSQELKKKNSKISSALSYAIGEQDSETTASRRLLSTVRDVDNDDNIRVYITLYEFSDENLDKLKQEGVLVEIYDKSQKLVQGKVATASLEKISDLSIVKFVDLPNVGFTNAGSVQTEGDAVLKADEARTTFGVDGTGIKVGVVSDGINGLTESIVSEDISSTGIMVPSSPLSGAGEEVNDPCPAFTTVTSTPAEREDITTGAEGLAMLEIIHDLAPGAELFFANGGPTSLQHQRSKKCLTEMVDIIADDVGFLVDGPYDGTSPVSMQSTASVQAGVANFIAVGNYAQRHYQGVFTDTDNDGIHEFDRSLGMNDGEPIEIYFVIVPPFTPAFLVLQWDDQWGTSSNDYDMLVICDDGSILSSENVQNGNGDPLESIAGANIGDSPLLCGISIYDYLKLNEMGSAQQRELELFYVGADALNTDFIVPESSLINNADAELACSVGAVGLGSGDPLGQSPEQIRDYSSRGPTNDGRMKPDLVAPDGVSITGNGGFGQQFDSRIIFAGTSAAAPHAAGVAALLLQADESLAPAAITAALQQSRALSPPQVADILSNTGVDLGPPGPDNTFGFGRIDAFAAVQSVVQAEPSPTPTQTPTPTIVPPTPTNSNPPGNSGGSNGGGGCSIGGNVTTATTFLNVLMPLFILVGFALVSRFKRTLE